MTRKTKACMSNKWWHFINLVHLWINSSAKDTNWFLQHFSQNANYTWKMHIETLRIIKFNHFNHRANYFIYINHMGNLMHIKIRWKKNCSQNQILKCSSALENNEKQNEKKKNEKEINTLKRITKKLWIC